MEVKNSDDILAICLTWRKEAFLKLVARASIGRFNKRVMKALSENQCFPEVPLSPFLQSALHFEWQLTWAEVLFPPRSYSKISSEFFCYLRISRLASIPARLKNLIGTVYEGRAVDCAP